MGRETSLDDVRMETVSAHGGKHAPSVGLGTWDLRGETCVRCVAEAIATGYRHIDTAALYGNEDRVGEGIRAAGARPRRRCSSPPSAAPPDLDDASFKSSIERSLKRIGVDQVDLVLIHSPGQDPERRPADRDAERDQAKRLDPPHRGFQLHDAVAGRGLGHHRRTPGHQPVRVPPLSRPAGAHRRLPRGGHDLHRVRAARASGRPRRSGDRRDRPAQWIAHRRRSCSAGKSSKTGSRPSQGVRTRTTSAPTSTSSSFSLDDDDMAAISALWRTRIRDGSIPRTPDLVRQQRSRPRLRYCSWSRAFVRVCAASEPSWKVPNSMSNRGSPSPL